MSAENNVCDDPWALRALFEKEVNERGTRAGYDLLLLHIDGFSDASLAHAVLYGMELPSDVDLHPRIAAARQFNLLKSKFDYNAGGSLSFKRDKETFADIFRKSLALPRPLAFEFLGHAARPSHWHAHHQQVMAALCDAEKDARVDDDVFGVIREAFMTDGNSFALGASLVSLPDDASKRMKDMVGTAAVKSEHYDVAIRAFLKVGVDPLSVEGANQVLCDIVRKARGMGPTRIPGVSPVPAQ